MIHRAEGIFAIEQTDGNARADNGLEYHWQIGYIVLPGKQKFTPDLHIM